MTTLIKTNGCKTQVPAAWNPFREMEERFGRVFAGLPVDPEWNVGNWTPAVDIHEDENQYTITADLPGVKKEDISLSVHDNVVTIKGERKQETEKQEKGYRRVERVYGNFQRAFQIPRGVDATKVEAKYENGVLNVVLPKPEAAKPRNIEVKVS